MGKNQTETRNHVTRSIAISVSIRAARWLPNHGDKVGYACSNLALLGGRKIALDPIPIPNDSMSSEQFPPSYETRSVLVFGLLSMRSLLPLTLLLAACNFDSSTAAALDPFAPDAMDPSAPDADPNAPDASTVFLCSDWNLRPNIVDPCDVPIEQDNLILTVPGAYRYNTDDGRLTNNLGQDVPSISTTIGQDPSSPRIMVTANLHIGPESSIRVLGSRPLIIFSWGGMVIEGGIDASSGSDGSGGGANSDLCIDAMPGDSAEAGSGGGGGGGLGQAGGKGGTGGPVEEANLGGDGGATLPVATSLAFHGGCAGGNGGDGEDEEDPDPALGGDGGGAVYLLARTNLNFRGSINAGGQGGESSNSLKAGGGGGGSGGMIVLEAYVLTLQLNSILTANGGGGGGGSDNMPDKADPGEPGSLAIVGSAGGDGEKSDKGAGGLGGAKNTPVLELAGQDSDSGAGGGGGGYGHIRVRSTHLTNNVSVDSPEAFVENSIGNPQ